MSPPSTAASPAAADGAGARAIDAEARRQQALLAALWAPHGAATEPPPGPAGARAAPPGWAGVGGADGVASGLQAYRGNAAATAARALEAAYPTVCALVGADDFRHLARAQWFSQPPTRGDLAEWDGALAEALEAHPALRDWPYLGDCARLDWAVHRGERAADAPVDAASFARLGDTDPARLHLLPSPGFALLRSRWPIATLHAAHREADREAGLAAAREALQRGAAETVVVAREGWRVAVTPVDAVEADWIDRLLAGESLAAALEAVGAAHGDRFDFGAWLARALGAGWLQGLRVSPDPG